jgi:hypothetical protein
MAVTIYDKGDRPKLVGQFTDVNGTPTDPAQVFFTVRDPNGNETNYQYSVNAELVRESAGVYYVLVDCNVVGDWDYRFYSSGAGQTAGEERFHVRLITSCRVTDSEVKGILDTTIETYPFIQTANHIVNTNLGGLLAETTLKQIELWLAAHLACMMDPRESRVKAGEAEATFEGKTDMGLNFTRYGQMVKLLDTTGRLSTLGLQRARISAVARGENE